MRIDAIVNKRSAQSQGGERVKRQRIGESDGSGGDRTQISVQQAIAAFDEALNVHVHQSTDDGVLMVTQALREAAVNGGILALQGVTPTAALAVPTELVAQAQQVARMLGKTLDGVTFPRGMTQMPAWMSCLPDLVRVDATGYAGVQIDSRPWLRAGGQIDAAESTTLRVLAITEGVSIRTDTSWPPQILIGGTPDGAPGVPLGSEPFMHPSSIDAGNLNEAARFAQPLVDSRSTAISCRDLAVSWLDRRIAAQAPGAAAFTHMATATVAAIVATVTPRVDTIERRLTTRASRNFLVNGGGWPAFLLSQFQRLRGELPSGEAPATCSSHFYGTLRTVEWGHSIGLELLVTRQRGGQVLFEASLYESNRSACHRSMLERNLVRVNNWALDSLFVPGGLRHYGGANGFMTLCQWQPTEFDDVPGERSLQTFTAGAAPDFLTLGQLAWMHLPDAVVDLGQQALGAIERGEQPQFLAQALILRSAARTAVRCGDAGNGARCIESYGRLMRWIDQQEALRNDEVFQLLDTRSTTADVLIAALAGGQWPCAQAYGALLREFEGRLTSEQLEILLCVPNGAAHPLRTGLARNDALAVRTYVNLVRGFERKLGPAATDRLLRTHDEAVNSAQAGNRWDAYFAYASAME